jgi:hypothetical protein
VRRDDLSSNDLDLRLARIDRSVLEGDLEAQGRSRYCPICSLRISATTLPTCTAKMKAFAAAL